MVKEIYAISGEIALVDDDVFEELSNFSWSFNKNKKTFIWQKREAGESTSTYLTKKIYELKGIGAGRFVYQKTKGNDFTLVNLTNEKPVYIKVRSIAGGAKAGPKAGEYKGVSFRNDENLWRAAMSFQCEYKSSRHKTEIEAAKAYDAIAFAAHGTDCYLNFPEDYGLPARERDDNG